MGGLQLYGDSAACTRCHGADAMGQLEGGLAAPALVWRLMRASTPARPGYDAASLWRALAEGQDSAGRALHPVMPRYDLREADITSLIAFLQSDRRSAVGVSGDEIRIAVPHLAGDAFVPTLLNALWAAPGRNAWGRRLRAVALPVAADGQGAQASVLRAAATLAAVAGPGARVPGLDAALQAADLPHLFPLDSYDAAPTAAVLAEAPIAVQVSILKRHAEAMGGAVALLCGERVLEEQSCTDRLPAGIKAVVAARQLRSDDLAWLPAGVTVFLPFDHAAALLRQQPKLAFPLVVADPRGRLMPGSVLEELRRLAPALLARQPDLARRIHAAADLTALALQRAGPWPVSTELRAALANIAAGQVSALIAPMNDGIRIDAAYGVQLFQLRPGSSEAQVNVTWERP
ncbi:c-type cytochrome [Belnapia rosea]|nr:c-type cytochrome [Belnapia rosea]